MLSNLSAGKNLPESFNVIIEIPSDSKPVKYEVDKDTGLLFVDRFLGTAMQYPCEYGFIPHTLSDDGDPTDVLVLSPISLFPGSVIEARPVGMLIMTDESGVDAKVLAVPVDKISKAYSHIKDIQDVDKLMLDKITHFFEHYKDLEPNKWVKVEDWKDVATAKEEIVNSVANYKKS